MLNLNLKLNKMAKSKLVEQEEIKQELQQVADALAEKDLYEVPSQEDAPLYKPQLNQEKEVVSTPGHTTRAFRS